jgi:VWFA-related protein
MKAEKTLLPAFLGLLLAATVPYTALTASAQDVPEPAESQSGGTSVAPKRAESDELKLLKLNTLLHQDELRALPEIEQILKNDSSEMLKEKAVFLLAHGKSPQARELLEQIALGRFNPAQPNPAVQAKAASLIRLMGYGTVSTPYPPTLAGSRALTLDVVVTDKSGRPVSGLEAKDFTLLDNKQPQTIFSIQPASGIVARPDPPVELILLIDAVNTDALVIHDELEWLHKYLQGKSGAPLALPTSFAILTDTGIVGQDTPSRDPKALEGYLDRNRIGLRALKNSTGLDGGEEREMTSLKALQYLCEKSSGRPGRKLLIWISPGWSGISDPVWLGSQKEQQKTFDGIVLHTNSLREARLTLDSIDPTTNIPDSYYKRFLKGAIEPKKADYGHLLLQVLATQSGGQVLAGNVELPALIDRCVADASAYYIVTYNRPPAARDDEYHEIEVQVQKPGLKSRTRTGYYAQP